MFDFKRIRPIDAAIAVVAVLVIVLGSYLGYSMWAAKRQAESTNPAARAVDDLVAAVRKDPDNLFFRLRLAQALAMAGRRNESIRQYETLLEVQEDYVPALAGLGILALEDKEYMAAESYYRKAIEVLSKQTGDQRNAQLEASYFYLATALMEQKQYEDAAGYFKEALRIRRDSSVTHYLLSVCLREMGYDRAQKESLENTLLFDPQHPEANYDLGNVLLAEDDLAGAAEHFRRSADAAPNAKQPREALAKLGTASEHIAKARQLAKADRTNAIVEARVAVAIDPRSAEAYVLLGELYEEDGNKTKARESFTAAMDLDKNNEKAKAGLERVDDGS